MYSAKTAILIGATGLVGSHILQQLLISDQYKKVKVFTRRSTGITHTNLEEHIVDFEETKKWANKLTGDDLFSCLGTTLKKAGGKENQWRIDYTYQYQTAKTAADNGVKSMVLCSSAGASPGSNIFYLKMKGELDRDVQNLAFNRVRIIKPSTLDGKRTERRPGEKLYIPLSKLITRLPFLRKYTAIHAEIVATAMIKSLILDPEEKVAEYEFLEVFDLAR
jgi:uncharacterized protein YbjT (DUF2867 family)